MKWSAPRFIAYVVSVVFVCALRSFLIDPADAATTAGTVITNTSTATYGDGTTNYNAQSNTVSTTVQNAPALTISPTVGSPGSQSVSPGGTVTDTYVLSNVGNAAGVFALSGTQDTDEGVTSGSGSFGGYVVTVGVQTSQTFTTIAAVNTYLATQSIPNAPAGGPTVADQATIGVTYTANAGSSGTITTKLTATITQPAGTGIVATTSTPATTGQYNDTVVDDARMDVQVTAAVAGTSAAPTVAYTLRYNNGGGRAMVAVNRAGLPAGGGITGAGIIVTSKLPQYPSGTTLAVSGTPSFLNTPAAPAGAQIIYSTDGSAWTTTAASPAAYIGVFIPASALTGAFGASNPGSAQNSVTLAQAQLAFTFTLTGSTANGAANPTAITDVANSIFGDSSGFIEGPGITAQTVANTGTATVGQTAPAITNTNGALSGAGQVTSAAAPGGNAVLNGPSGQSGATGPDGSTATDYTVMSYTNGGTLTSAVNGSKVAVPAAGAPFTFTNTVSNGGNQADTYNLTMNASLPTGWTAQFQVLGVASASLAVASGATAQYTVVVTPSASATTADAYVLYTIVITATSTNDSLKSNVTTDEFLVGGFVKLITALAVATGQTCANATTFTGTGPTANPGDCMQYTVTYTNVAPSGGTGSVTLNAVTLLITQDGTSTGGTGSTAYTNNWATNTNGLYAAPLDSTGGTLGGYSGGAAALSTKFTDTIATLAAGASGTVTFKVQLK